MNKLRHYQEEAVTRLTGATRGILVAAGGSGKTVCACAAIDRMCARKSGLSVLWLAPTLELLDQAAATADLFDLTRKCKFVTKCYQAGECAKGYDICVLDEAHVAAAPTFRKLIAGYDGILWGLTATPGRDRESYSDLVSLIGPVIYEIGREDLLKEGFVAPASVSFYAPNEEGEMAEAIHDDTEKRFSRMKYALPHVIKQLSRQPIELAAVILGRNMTEALVMAEQHGLDSAAPLARLSRYSSKVSEWIARAAERELKSRALWQSVQFLAITQNTRRNNLIIELAQQQTRPTIILVNTIVHGQWLSKRIPGSLLLHSKMNNRDEAVKKVRDGSVRVAIATSLLDTGFDAPCLEVIIVTTAGRSSIKSIQRTARVLRPYEQKESGRVIDFWDWQHPMLRDQSRARGKIYYDLKYDFVGSEEILPVVLKSLGISIHPALGLSRGKPNSKESGCINHVQRLSSATVTPDTKDTKERDHSVLSPSILKNKAVCPGFINDYGDKPSADRGTLGHKGVETRNPELAGDDTALRESIAKCIAYEDRIRAKFGGNVKKFQEIRLHYFDQWGYADLILIAENRAALIDWKFAYNLYEADSPQFWAYCKGIWDKWPDVDSIDVHVGHPFLNVTDVETFNRVTHYSKFSVEIKAISERARKNDPKDYRITDQCRYCGFAGKCPKLAELGYKIGQRYGSDIEIPDIDFHGSQVSDPSIMAALLRLAPIVKKAASGWVRAALDMYDNGLEIPGFKVLQRSGKKDVASAKVAYEIIKRNFVPQITPEEFLTHCNVSLPSLEELVSGASPRGEKGRNTELFEAMLEDEGCLVTGAAARYMVPIRKGEDDE